MKTILINTTHSLKSTGQIVFSEFKEFTKDSDSIKYLESIEQNKMQRIFDGLSLGKYSKSKIVKNANSVYSSVCWGANVPSQKNLYRTIEKENDIRTTIDIKTIPNIEDLENKKVELLHKAETLVKFKNQLFPNMDIASPMSLKEKELTKEIANIYSRINQIVLEKRKLSK